MKDYKVSAQSLISWQSKSKKNEKMDFENLKIQLDIPLAPARIAGRE
jgi:hypothetical protein